MSRRYDPTCLTSSDSRVYHRIGAIKHTDQDIDYWQWTTACGKAVDKTWGIRSIDRPRAELLARPCGKCFRGEGQ